MVETDEELIQNFISNYPLIYNNLYKDIVSTVNTLEAISSDNSDAKLYIEKLNILKNALINNLGKQNSTGNIKSIDVSLIDGNKGDIKSIKINLPNKIVLNIRYNDNAFNNLILQSFFKKFTEVINDERTL